MGKKSGGSSAPPAPPDPKLTAEAQSQANREAIELSAKMNRINEYTPLGNRTYSENGDGTYSATTTLSPAEQSQYDMRNALAATLGGKALDWGQNLNLGAQPRIPNAADYNGDKAADAVFNRAKMYLDPVYEENSRALEQRLHDQGLAPGSEGYQIQNRQFGDQRARDYQGAAYTAVGAGQSEAQREFANAMSVLQAQTQQRSQPLNDLAQLLSLTPQGSMPSFQPNWQAPTLPTDTISPTLAAYQGQLSNYNAEQQRGAAGKGALGSIIGTLGGAAVRSGPDYLGKGSPMRIPGF